MKNYKLIPLLAMTAILAGCGVNKGAKAPKFAKLGEEISAAELIEAVNSTDFLGGWTNPEAETPSAKFVEKTSAQANEKIYSNKKVLQTTTYKESAETSFEIDMTSRRGKLNYIAESEENTKNSLGTSKNSSKDVTNSIYQFCNSSHTGEEKEYLIRADLDSKFFALMSGDVSTYADEDKLQVFYDQVFSQTDFAYPYEFMTFPSYYPGLSYEKQREYKLYKNNSIYTIVVEGDFTTPEYDPSHNLINTRRNKSTVKMQIDVTEGSTYKYAISREVDYRVDYFENTFIGDQIIRAGDYAEGKEVFYKQVNVNVCEVKLEAVDISEYKLG